MHLRVEFEVRIPEIQAVNVPISLQVTPPDPPSPSVRPPQAPHLCIPVDWIWIPVTNRIRNSYASDAFFSTRASMPHDYAGWEPYQPQEQGESSTFTDPQLTEVPSFMLMRAPRIFSTAGVRLGLEPTLSPQRSGLPAS